MKLLPLVCIVIVNWNGGENITNCLESLKITDYNNYKIIVLDNCSTDDSIKRISKFKEVILLKSRRNLGFTSGSNFLFSFAINSFNPKYICNMNNDIITIQEEWLKLMVDELEKEQNRGICGNKLIFPDGRLQLLYLERPRKDYTEKDEDQYNFIKEVTAVGGANILIKKDVFDSIGGTDENYFYGSDDIDFCFRARKAGFKIMYNGFSKSVHIGSFSYKSSSKDFIYKHQSYAMILFSLRHENLIKNIKMIINQLARAIITRKDPFAKITLTNLCFHLSFPKRTIIFSKGLIQSLRNYKNIDNSYYITKVIKAKDCLSICKRCLT